jgi:hypothetical protein
MRLVRRIVNKLGIFVEGYALLMGELFPLLNCGRESVLIA